MKKLNDILDCKYDIQINGVAEDSRNVKDGFLFVATKGYNVDHFDYIADAIANGAVAVVSPKKIETDINVPIIIVEDIDRTFFDICCKYYDVTPSEFKFIGITGTDGKTTTATITSEILNKDEACAYIGTNGVSIGNNTYPTNNTTPCLGELFDCLRFIKLHKCKQVVMEVSSEALLHNRLINFKFDIIAYTNITEDHLNIHKTLENYRNCKFKLMDLLNEDGIIIINGDDDNCKLIKKKNVYSIGFNNDNNFFIDSVEEVSNCVKFNINHKQNKFNICSPLKGTYNVYNVTMAFSICLLKGMDINEIISCINKLNVVKGRREYLNFGQDYDIILDYAHTFNGIKCLLESFNNYKNIIVVTGAAGGREKEKRSKIGKLILDNSSTAIFTMDDPRYENVDTIIDEMVSNSSKDYLRIIDRKEAIFKALDLATSGSVVLIIGKGRDNYMAIEDKRIYYSDYDSITDYFEKKVH